MVDGRHNYTDYDKEGDENKTIENNTNELLL